MFSQFFVLRRRCSLNILFRRSMLLLFLKPFNRLRKRIFRRERERFFASVSIKGCNIVTADLLWQRISVGNRLSRRHSSWITINLLVVRQWERERDPRFSGKFILYPTVYASRIMRLARPTFIEKPPLPSKTGVLHRVLWIRAWIEKHQMKFRKEGKQIQGVSDSVLRFSKGLDIW